MNFSVLKVALRNEIKEHSLAKQLTGSVWEPTTGIDSRVLLSLIEVYEAANNVDRNIRLGTNTTNRDSYADCGMLHETLNQLHTVVEALK